MAHTRTLGDGAPVTASAFQKGLDFRVVDGQRLAHGHILVKDSCNVKEQITKRMGHAHPMPEKTISQVVAANLAYWMEQAEMTQTALAAKAGVSQKTISNYLNPDQRVESATGKVPSPKLEELDKIARVLAIPVWQLVREMSEKERKLYEHIERAYSELVSTEPVTESHELRDTGPAQQSGKKVALGRLPGEVLRTGQGEGKTGEVDQPGKVPSKRGSRHS